VGGVQARLLQSKGVLSLPPSPPHPYSHSRDDGKGRESVELNCFRTPTFIGERVLSEIDRLELLAKFINMNPSAVLTTSKTHFPFHVFLNLYSKEDSEKRKCARPCALPPPPPPPPRHSATNPSRFLFFCRAFYFFFGLFDGYEPLGGLSCSSTYQLFCQIFCRIANKFLNIFGDQRYFVGPSRSNVFKLQVLCDFIEEFSKHLLARGLCYRSLRGTGV